MTAHGMPKPSGPPLPRPNAAASWNAHTRDTNANDALIGREDIATADIVEDAGVWFGLGEHGTMASPDDSLGALPYGEYTIQEMRCEVTTISAEIIELVV